MCISKNGTLSNIFCDYFKRNSNIHNYGLQGANNFHAAASRTNIRKFSIRSMGPIIWNDIPDTIRNAHNLHIFKRLYTNNLIDRYQCL